MGYGKCEACADPFVWLPSHKCKPTFRVWCPDYGQEEGDGDRRLRALDHEEAAMMWAARSDSDSADYSIVGGSDVDVLVRGVDDDEPKRFRVYGEMVPSYSARAVG